MSLSVIMSVYNGDKWLEEAIASVLSQLSEEDEFLIRDDGSNDRSADMLESLNDQRIKIFRGENIGLTKSLNFLLDKAKGDHIARMDADDLSLSHRFESQLKELDLRNLDLISSAPQRIDAAGNDLAEGRGIFDETRLNRFNGFTHGSWLFKRTILDQGFRYDESYAVAQDYDFLLRLKANGFRLGVSNQVTYKRRDHEETVTAKKRLHQLHNMFRAQINYWQLLKDHPRSLSERCIAHFRQGNLLRSFLFFIRSVFRRNGPSFRKTISEIWFYFRNKTE